MVLRRKSNILRVIINIILVLIITIYYSQAIIPAYATNDFMGERYVGWYWFDEQESATDKEEAPLEPSLAEYLANEKEMKEFSRMLELKRFMMIMHPDNLEYMKQYREMEGIMRRNSETLAKNYALVNFLYPEFVDQLNRPVNLYGRKLKKQHQRKIDEQQIKELSKEFELFVFLSKGDPYSATLDKHLSNFNKLYGYEITAVTRDGSRSAYFETYNDKGGSLGQALSLKAIPSILAISKDSKERYEIARGVISIEAIEMRLLLINRARQMSSEHSQTTGKTNVK